MSTNIRSKERSGLTEINIMEHAITQAVMRFHVSDYEYAFPAEFAILYLFLRKRCKLRYVKAVVYLAYVILYFIAIHVMI